MNYIFNAKIRPNSPEFKISKFSDTIIISTQNQPENNKANLEIIKELSKIFGKNAKILRGLKSKNKTILIEGITEKEFEKSISGVKGCIKESKIINPLDIKKIWQK